MIAHRGLSGLERENSMKAFVAAVNRSFYGTECDIHLTKDKIFVISAWISFFCSTFASKLSIAGFYIIYKRYKDSADNKKQCVQNI